MKVKLVDGGLKFAIYMIDVIPDDWETETLERMRYVQEVSSSHAQDYKVVFHLDSAEDFNMTRYKTFKEIIRNVLKHGPAIRALQKIANSAADARGHFLRWERNSPTVATAECMECGRWVLIDVKPPQNGIDIGGPAVAVHCEEIGDDR